MIPATAFALSFEIVCCINHLITILKPDGALVLSQPGLTGLKLPTININPTSEFHPINVLTKIDLVIVEYKSEFEIKQALDLFKKLNISGVGSKFILIGENFTYHTVKILFENRIFNAVLIESKAKQAYTYFTYRNPNISKNEHSDLKNLGRCEVIKTFPSFEQAADWKNYNASVLFHPNVPYALGVYENPKGIEIDIFRLIFEDLGMSFHFEQESNFSNWLTRRLGYEYDIFIGNIGLKTEIREFIFPYLVTSMYFFIPTPNYVPRWKFIFKIFSVEVYILWFSSLLAVMLIWSLTTGNTRPVAFVEFFLTASRVFLEQKVSIISRSFAQKCLMVVIIILMVLMNYFFKSCFTFMLNGVTIEKGITTIEELMNSSIKIGGSIVERKRWRAIPVDEEFLENHFILCDLSENCIKRAAFRRDIAVAKPLITLQAIRKNYLDNDGRDLLQPLEKPWMSCYIISAVIPKGTFLHDLMDKYMKRLVDHGIVQKILSNYRPRDIKTSRTKFQKLKLDHIETAAIIWLVGISFGLFCFLIEKKWALCQHI